MKGLQKYEKPDQRGWIGGEPNKVYHANPAVSNTQLKAFHESPLDYEAEFITKTKQRGSRPEFALGSAIHSLVLEGRDAFLREFSVLPEMDFRSKQGKLNAIIAFNETREDPLPEGELFNFCDLKKEDIEKFFRSIPGREILTQEQLDTSNIVMQKIHDDGDAMGLMQEGYAETVFRADVDLLAVQCRPDWINWDGCKDSDMMPYIADIKTISRLDNWGRQFQDFGYYRAWAFYTKVIELVWGIPASDIAFYWIVAETTFPHRVQVVKAPIDWFELGLNEVSSDILELSRMMKEGFSDPGVGNIRSMGYPPRYLLEREVRPGIIIRGLEGGDK